MRRPTGSFTASESTLGARCWPHNRPPHVPPLCDLPARSALKVESPDSRSSNSSERHPTAAALPDRTSPARAVRSRKHSSPGATLTGHGAAPHTANLNVNGAQRANIQRHVCWERRGTPPVTIHQANTNSTERQTRASIPTIRAIPQLGFFFPIPLGMYGR